MFLSNASVARPIAMSCLIIALALLGFNAYRKIGLELMPRVDMPYITIVTVYPGATPQEIEADICKPIEDEVVAIDGLKHVSSSAMENACQTLLEFHLEVDVDIAATDVREKIDIIKADLPADAEDPQILKYDVNAKPIIQLALTGDASVEELYDYADNTLKDRITVISGVAEAKLVGGAEREVHVLLDRDKLAARGLSSMSVVTAIQNGVRIIPSGRVRDNGTEYTVKFDADFKRAADIGNLEVACGEGRRCYIKDFGRVVMTTEELRQAAYVDGRPAVAVKVVKKSDANAVAVVRQVRKAMADIRHTLPGGMELIWVTDDGTFTEATVNSAWSNVFQGIGLTAAILFIFLYNFRSLLVIAVTMPLTIVIGLFIMQALGYSLNTSTLLAIGMSVGVLVTNSIVVLEAIVKRLSETGDVKQSARLGTGEAFIAVLASAATNIVVLFPMAVMGGMLGMFIRFFAMTMVIMTAVSLFISFTLTPLLCSVILKPREEGSRSLLAVMERGWNRMFEGVLGGYRALLSFTERRRWAAVVILLAVAGLFVHSLGVAAGLGFGFFSEADRGEMFVKLEFPTRYSLAQTTKRVRQAEAILCDLPELRHMLTTIGKVEGMFGQSSEGVHLAQLLLRFSEKTERTVTIEELQNEARARLASYPDAIITVSLPSFIGGQSSDIELEIAGEELNTLDRLALRIQELAGSISGIQDPDTTVREGKPELRIIPRRAVLADLKSPATGLGTALRANLEGLEAGTYKQGARNYDIVVKLEEREGKRQVRDFLFPGTDGHPLVLASLGHVVQDMAPVQITRKDKRRVSKLFANLDPALPMGSAVDRISAVIDEQGELPPGYGYKFAGVYEVMAEGQQNLAEAGLIGIILVILTLAAILESFKQPLVILVTLPLALIGMFWALALGGKSIEMFAIMGGVMLIGIVVNNAILIIEQFNLNLKAGQRRHEAMVAAACDRFRPVVMITLAAVLGMMPLALGQGLGAELRQTCGIASVGGILVSGVLTIIVLPVMYNLFTRNRRAVPESGDMREDAGPEGDAKTV